MSRLTCVILLLGTLGCSRHVSDEKLIRQFKNSPKQFEDIARMAKEDHLAEKVGGRFLFDITTKNFEGIKDYSGLTSARADQYRNVLNALGVTQGIGVTQSSIFLRVEGPTILNGDSEKGYYFNPNATHSSVNDLNHQGIDHYESGRRTYIYYRQLGQGWYLYLLYYA